MGSVQSLVCIIQNGIVENTISFHGSTTILVEISMFNNPDSYRGFWGSGNVIFLAFRSVFNIYPVNIKKQYN